MDGVFADKGIWFLGDGSTHCYNSTGPKRDCVGEVTKTRLAVRPRRDCGMNLTKTQTRMRIRVSGRREGEGKTIPARKVKKPKIEKYRLGKNV